MAYGIAIVKGTEQREAAQRFIDGLLDGSGAAALKRAGFGLPAT